MPWWMQQNKSFFEILGIFFKKWGTWTWISFFISCLKMESPNSNFLEILRWDALLIGILYIRWPCTAPTVALSTLQPLIGTVSIHLKLQLGPSSTPRPFVLNCPTRIIKQKIHKNWYKKKITWILKPKHGFKETHPLKIQTFLKALVLCDSVSGSIPCHGGKPSIPPSRQQNFHNFTRLQQMGTLCGQFPWNSAIGTTPFGQRKD